MTESFLEFSRSRGNDLITPRPELAFPGLQPGDKWCICLARWIEAVEAGCGPRIDLEACHASALEFVPLEKLRAFALEGGENPPS